MEEQRVSETRLSEMASVANLSGRGTGFSMVDSGDLESVCRELQTSRAALSEAEGLVREMAKAIRILGTVAPCDVEKNPAECRWCQAVEMLDRDDVAAILARGEK